MASLQEHQARTAASITALGQRILSMNLCREIMLPMSDGQFYPRTTLSILRLPRAPKYKFSRARWYEAEYNWIHQAEVVEWCTEQFGPHPEQPDAWSRWNHKWQDRIQFRDERDYVLFQLRWS